MLDKKKIVRLNSVTLAVFLLIFAVHDLLREILLGFVAWISLIR